MAGLRKHLTEREFFFFKLLMWSAFFIVPAFAVTLAIVLMLLGSGSVEKEHGFYRAIESPTTFRLRDLFPGERHCVAPGGIGNNPENYLLWNFPRLRVSRTRPYDSQDDWFIIMLSDRTNSAEINSIRYAKANLESEEAICGANIEIVVDHERNVRALTGRDPGSPADALRSRSEFR